MLHVLIFIVNSFNELNPSTVKFPVRIVTSSTWSWDNPCLVLAATTPALPGLAHKSSPQPGEEGKATPSPALTCLDQIQGKMELW